MSQRITREAYATGIKRAWYPVATSSSLDTPQGTTLLGQHVVAFRTESGTAAVLDGRCVHRGADLSQGETKGDTLACPYHGWQYGIDGVCTRIPSRGEDGRIPPTALIGAYPAVEKYGLVWTCLDDDPMLEVPDLADLDQLGYTFMNADPIETSAGFVNSLENFRDVAHLPFVHRASIGQFQPGEVAPLEVETSGYESRMVRILPVDDESAGGGAYGAADGLEVTYHTIAPSLTSARLNLGAMGQRIVMECFQPIGLDGACRIFLVSGTAADYTATTPAEALEMELTVLREDVPILNGLVPPEVPILHDEPEVSTASDRYTLASRQAILAFARDAADTAGSTPVAFDSTS